MPLRYPTNGVKALNGSNYDIVQKLRHLPDSVSCIPQHAEIRIVVHPLRIVCWPEVCCWCQECLRTHAQSIQDHCQCL